jgi:hypothetical protein
MKSTGAVSRSLSIPMPRGPITFDPSLNDARPGRAPAVRDAIAAAGLIHNLVAPLCPSAMLFVPGPAASRTIQGILAGSNSHRRRCCSMRCGNSPASHWRWRFLCRCEAWCLVGADTAVWRRSLCRRQPPGADACMPVHCAGPTHTSWTATTSEAPLVPATKSLATSRLSARTDRFAYRRSRRRAMARLDLR